MVVQLDDMSAETSAVDWVVVKVAQMVDPWVARWASPQVE